VLGGLTMRHPVANSYSVPIQNDWDLRVGKVITANTMCSFLPTL